MEWVLTYARMALAGYWAGILVGLAVSVPVP